MKIKPTYIVRNFVSKEIEITDSEIEAGYHPLGTKGWGNAYVGVSKSHPWYEKGYRDIREMIPRNLLEGDESRLIFKLNIARKGDNGLWLVGFTTDGAYDSLYLWSKQIVIQASLMLENIAQKAIL